MSISVIKEQEAVLSLLKDKDLFEEYFQPLVGLPQSDNHHGMDAMQHTIAVVRSIENVLNELDKTQEKRYSANDIMSLHIAALFHDTGERLRLRSKLDQMSLTIKVMLKKALDFYGNFIRLSKVEYHQICVEDFDWHHG